MVIKNEAICSLTDGYFFMDKLKNVMRKLILQRSCIAVRIEVESP